MRVILQKLSLWHLFHLFSLWFVVASDSPFLSLTLLDYWSVPLGELSKCVCGAKTEQHRFPLLCSLLAVCVLSERLRRSHGEVTGGPAGQLVLIASRGLFSGGRLVSLAAQM